MLATGGADSVVKIWDCNQNTSTFDCLDTVKIFSKPISAVAFSPNGEFLAGASVDRNLKVYSTKYRR
jgi:WD40 repeat protein